MWELIKDFAGWTGWFPITVGTIIVMLLGRYFFDREIKFKDLQINKLKDDLEDSKQYRVDVLTTSLEERLKIAHRELERLREDKNASEEEIADKKQEILLAQNEIRELSKKLQQYEYQLDNLLDDEPDFCMVCDVDDEHVLLNTISWGFSMEDLTGDTALVEKQGTCLYCGSVNLKCKVCGSITGIDTNSHDGFECEGGCGNIYTLVSKVVENHTRYTIRVSRM